MRIAPILIFISTVSALSAIFFIRVHSNVLLIARKGAPLKVLTYVSSNFVEITGNWWHYLRPYAEESGFDVIVVGLSPGMCDELPKHEKFNLPILQRAEARHDE
eukprot:Selendium_serpulae@DN3622_c0_g2_i1.p1